MTQPEMIEFLEANGFKTGDNKFLLRNNLKCFCMQRNYGGLTLYIYATTDGEEHDVTELGFDRYFDKEHFLELISHYEKKSETFESELKYYISRYRNISFEHAPDNIARFANDLHKKYGGK